MEYETKKWVVRWTSYFDHRLKHQCRRVRDYDRQFKNQFTALRFYRKMLEKEVLSVYLIRIDVRNNEYVLDSIDMAVPVTYSEV